MRRYIKFDSEQFIKDSREWDCKLSNLRAELDSITEIGGSGGGMPPNGGISNPVARTAEERDTVLSKINRIEEYKTCFRYAWDCIGDEDKLLLTGFYFAPGYVYEFVDQWCTDRGSNREYCYRAKREALDRFGRACERWMELNGYDV